eukprot:SAG31_NODE_61_length_29286_cov_444.645973_2_plen_97_part_00
MASPAEPRPNPAAPATPDVPGYVGGGQPPSPNAVAISETQNLQTNGKDLVRSGSFYGDVEDASLQRSKTKRKLGAAMLDGESAMLAVLFALSLTGT